MQFENTLNFYSTRNQSRQRAGRAFPVYTSMNQDPEKIIKNTLPVTHACGCLLFFILKL